MYRLLQAVSPSREVVEEVEEEAVVAEEDELRDIPVAAIEAAVATTTRQCTPTRGRGVAPHTTKRGHTGAPHRCGTFVKGPKPHQSAPHRCDPLMWGHLSARTQVVCTPVVNLATPVLGG